ncbi:hypothetical protein NEOLI_005455 [Neolecta irregularis DAH-3]|uniref:Uncharacterized protein n=1 Tax=Neolecta irregularis (strain DAH-3) TaxID=1198029 RepID=A0A1U7LI39_NEOID|nr:hypothetical protein NEOLI_005455 [Neolecta irregularis DAH-3]|eukprot:OLL22317.1 hypothetical protein NEOLI_005455 [Neolecta irregularis DAH-3]
MPRSPALRLRPAPVPRSVPRIPRRLLFGRVRTVTPVPDVRPGFDAYLVTDTARPSRLRPLLARAAAALFGTPLPRHPDLWCADPALLAAVARPQFHAAAKLTIQDYFATGKSLTNELKLHADPARLPKLGEIASLDFLALHGQAGDLEFWECLLKADKSLLLSLLAQKFAFVFHEMQNSLFTCRVELLPESTAPPEYTQKLVTMRRHCITRTLLTYRVTDANNNSAIVKLATPWINMYCGEFNLMDPDDPDYCNWLVADVDGIVDDKLWDFVKSNMVMTGELENKRWYAMGER